MFILNSSAFENISKNICTKESLIKSLNEGVECYYGVVLLQLVPLSVDGNYNLNIYYLNIGNYMCLDWRLFHKIFNGG